MSFTEFIGIMAEAEFYHLFRMAIDKKDSGYLKARDLDRVLCSMRDQNAPGNRPCRDKVSSGLFVLALWKKKVARAASLVAAELTSIGSMGLFVTRIGPTMSYKCCIQTD